MDGLGTLLPGFLSAGDIAALVVFFACLFGMGLLVEYSGDGWPSTHRLMGYYRRRWMREVPFRSNRVLDSTLLITLRNGSAFFASGTMIAVGGIAALLGQTDRLVTVAEDFAGDLGADQVAWEGKLLFILLLVVSAFLNFVWSHRLFGYCAILMGAIPENGPGAADVEGTRAGADRAADLNISAGRSFNRGLRSVYFALAALAWFLGPLALVVASFVVTAVIYRREYHSRSRAALLAGWSPGEPD